MSRRLSPQLLGLAVVWAATAALLSEVALSGWHPHDEGALAHAAERVLSGELPHRDFDAVYTGGLELLHALAFQLFGLRLVSLRLVLLGASLLFIPVFYWVALRLLSPLWAAAATFAALVWSLPAYFASMPSWYVTFCAVFTGAALLRFLDVRRTRWLVLAGVCGGIAFLMKVIGLFVVIAALLFLVRVEQEEAAKRDGARSKVASGFVLLGCALVVAGLVALVRQRLGVMEFIHFVLPGAALAVLVAIDEIRQGRGSAGERLRGFARLAGPLLLGAALPVGLFLLPYATSGAIGDFLVGVFVLPQRRLSAAFHPLPPAWTLVASVPAAVLLFAPRLVLRLRPRAAVIVLGAALLSLAALGASKDVYTSVWYGLRPLIPLATMAVVVELLGSRVEPQARLPVFLVASLAAFVGLQQFPFSFGIYFCYVAPLAVLALAAVARHQAGSVRALYAVVLAFFVVFAVLWIDRGRMAWTGREFMPEPVRAELAIDRGGLDIPADQAAVYIALVEAIRAHSAPGSAIFVTADAPQVYFLADRRNPTRTLYDFLDEDFGVDSAGRRARIMRALAEQDVKAVVLNASGEFSGPIHPRLAADLRARYPHQANFAFFTLLWRP